MHSNEANRLLHVLDVAHHVLAHSNAQNAFGQSKNSFGRKVSPGTSLVLYEHVSIGSPQVSLRRFRLAENLGPVPGVGG